MHLPLLQRMCLKAVIALLQFTTILPLGKSVELEHFARRLYLYPVAGYVVGGAAAALAFFVFPRSLSAAVALATVLVISGFHHLDGLLDLGDMLMVHGSKERRIAVLSDPHVGTGGLGLGIVVLLLSFGALLSLREIWVAILAAEVMAKAAMVCISVLGVPFREGIHSFLYRHTKVWFALPAYLLTLPLLLVLQPFAYAIALAAGIFVPLLVLVGSRRLLGGVNGDIVGATNEIARAFTLVVLALGTHI